LRKKLTGVGGVARWGGRGHEKKKGRTKRGRGKKITHFLGASGSRAFEKRGREKGAEHGHCSMTGQEKKVTGVKEKKQELESRGFRRARSRFKCRGTNTQESLKVKGGGRGKILCVLHSKPSPREEEGDGSGKYSRKKRPQS